MAPVHFGDLASPGSPGVRLREGSGPVRLCCGGLVGPQLILEWAASSAVDLITGSPVVAVGAPPVVSPGLGGVLKAKGGVLADPMPVPGMPITGASVYFLVAKDSGFPFEVQSNRIGGLKNHPASFAADNVLMFPGGVVQPPTTLGGNASGQGVGSGGGPGAGLVPEGTPTPVKSVLSVHYLPSGGPSGTIETRVNGVVSFFLVIPAIGTLPGLNNMLIGGSSNGGAPFAPTVSFDYYRAQFWDTNVYDATVMSGLLALLP